MGRLEEHAANRPDDVALIDGGKSRTWRQWNERATRIADSLVGRGVGAEDRVAVHTFNRIEWFDVRFALAKLGASMVSIGSRLTPGEVGFIVENSGSDILFSDDAQVLDAATTWSSPPSSRIGIGTDEGDVDLQQLIGEGAIEPLCEAEPSAGTTTVYIGRPEGAVRTGGEAQAQGVMELMQDMMPGFRMGPDERHLAISSLYDATPPVFSQMALLCGGRVYLQGRFDPERSLALMSKAGITSTFMVPTMLDGIVNLPSEVLNMYPLKSLRAVITGASPSTAAHKQRIAEVLGDVLYELHGSTGTGLNTYLERADALRTPGSVERLLPNSDANGAPAKSSRPRMESDHTNSRLSPLTPNATRRSKR